VRRYPRKLPCISSHFRGRGAAIAKISGNCYLSLKEFAMSETAAIEIERDVVDVAAQRAAEEGLSVAAYITQLLRRNFERASDEDSVLAYDHIGPGDDLQTDREPDEDDESYKRRTALYGDLFRRGR
jgi:hypothetical protein